MDEQGKAVEQGTAEEPVEEQGKVLKMPQRPYAFLLVGDDKMVDLTVNTFPLPLLAGALGVLSKKVHEAVQKAAEENGTGDKKVAEAVAPPSEAD